MSYASILLQVTVSPFGSGLFLHRYFPSCDEVIVILEGKSQP